MESASEITSLLSRVRRGDAEAFGALVSALYPELRRMARRRLGRERPNHTLQPTALLHEVYLELAGEQRLEFRDRAHFLAAAAQVMRRLLVDHARHRNAQKCGGGYSPMQLDEALVYSPERSSKLLDLEEALARLEEVDPVKARVVELKFFGGLSIPEIAEAINIGERTVKRYWEAARARLIRDLNKQTRRRATGRE